MRTSTFGTGLLLSGLASAAVLAATTPAAAYETYSASGGCVTCHGAFDSGNYTSLTGDGAWLSRNFFSSMKKRAKIRSQFAFFRVWAVANPAFVRSDRIVPNWTWIGS